MEGLRVSGARLIIYIHPSKANKVQQAILRQLSSFLFQYGASYISHVGPEYMSVIDLLLKGYDGSGLQEHEHNFDVVVGSCEYSCEPQGFDDAFDGVLLAYEIKFQDKTAKILPGIVPYFGVRVKAKLLIFSPKPEMLLEGKVVKLGRESIHVIVLGFSSAVITSEDVREEFRYKIKHDKEVFASTSYRKHVIKVGTILRFSVKSFDEEMLHISGSLIPEDTGCIRWLYRHTTDGLLHEHVTQGSTEIERTSKKHKGKSKEMSLQEQDSVEVSGRSNMSMTNSDRPHKSKKRRLYKS